MYRLIICNRLGGIFNLRYEIIIHFLDNTCLLIHVQYKHPDDLSGLAKIITVDQSYIETTLDIHFWYESVFTYLEVTVTNVCFRECFTMRRYHYSWPQTSPVVFAYPVRKYGNTKYWQCAQKSSRIVWSGISDQMNVLMMDSGPMQPINHRTVFTTCHFFANFVDAI